MAPKIKGIVFSAVSFIFAAIFWYFLKTFVYSGSTTGSILLGAWFVILSASYAVLAILLREKYLFWAVSILIILPILAIFQFNIPYLIFAALGMFILFSGFVAVGRLRDSQAKINLSSLINKASSYFFNTLIVVLLLVFYFSPVLQNTDKFQLPEFLFGPVLKASQPIISSYLPGFNPENTVDEAIVSVFSQTAKSQTGLNFGIQDLSALPQYRQFIKEQRDTLSSQIGIKLKGNEKVKDAMYEFINGKLSDFNKADPLYFQITMLLILFSIFKFLFWIAKYLNLLLVLATISLLKLLKFVRVDKIMVEKEELMA